MAELEVLSDAAVLIGDDGNIKRVGPRRDLERDCGDQDREEVDGVLFPGFVDSHTHGVFGMARTEDHERRARGISYMEIAAQGGGILSSVRDFRQRTAADLSDLTERRLGQLLRLGTTTVEIKSGYGLSTESELRALEVIREASTNGDGPDLIPTFLGAHEFPDEFREDREAYVDLVVREMIPAVREQGIARFCDVFCEPGVYSVPQSRRVLEAAQEAGFQLKLHADELEGSGGAELGADLGAVSADHLAAISDAGITRLAESDTVAVLLPGTQLFLGRDTRAPARRLIDAGAAVALATDFNPGSSPGLSLPLMWTLGVSQLGMTPAEALIGITVNAAAAVGEAHSRGQLAEGLRADLTLAAVRDWKELGYWYGANLVSRVWVRGSACHPGSAPVNYLA